MVGGVPNRHSLYSRTMWVMGAAMQICLQLDVSLVGGGGCSLSTQLVLKNSMGDGCSNAEYRYPKLGVSLVGGGGCSQSTQLVLKNSMGDGCSNAEYRYPKLGVSLVGGGGCSQSTQLVLKNSVDDGCSNADMSPAGCRPSE